MQLGAASLEPCTNGAKYPVNGGDTKEAFHADVIIVGALSIR